MKQSSQLPNQIVRNDPKSQTLNGYLSVNRSVGESGSAASIPTISSVRYEHIYSRQSIYKYIFLSTISFLICRAKQPKLSLTSIENLWKSVESDTHQGNPYSTSSSSILPIDSPIGLEEIFRNCTFVGRVEEGLIVIQHQTKLYIVNLCVLR